jgi:hypothetical protein
MGNTAKIEINDKVHEFPIVEGTEHERSIDISTLRGSTGCLDDSKGRIYRPRQGYVGPTLNHYVPMEDRAGEAR